MENNRPSRNILPDNNDNSRELLSILKDNKTKNISLQPRDQIISTTTSTTTGISDDSHLCNQNDIDKPILFQPSQSFDDILLFSHNNSRLQQKYYLATKNSPSTTTTASVTRAMSYDWGKPSTHIQQNIPYRIVMKNNQPHHIYSNDRQLYHFNKPIATNISTNSTNSIHQPQMTTLHFSNGYPRIQKHMSYTSGDSYFERPKTQRFVQWQIDILESYFKKSFYVTKEEKIRISEETGLTVRQISVWFQNRRAKKKR